MRMSTSRMAAGGSKSSGTSSVHCILLYMETSPTNAPVLATGPAVGSKSTSRRVLPWLFVFAVGAAATFQVYHSQFASGFDLFPGPRGDTRLCAYLIEHWYQYISGHADLRSPAMFYPVKSTLGFSDVFLIYAPGY